MTGKSTIAQTGGNIMANKPLLIVMIIVIIIIALLIWMYTKKWGIFSPSATDSPDDE